MAAWLCNGIRRARHLHRGPAAATRMCSGVPPAQRVGLFACGEGYLGALGLGTSEYVEHPTLLPGLAVTGADVVSASCGWGHSAAITSDGAALLWGRPYDFKNTLRLVNFRNFSPALARLLVKLASRTVVLSDVPTRIDGADDEHFVSVSCGQGALTCAVTDSGKVFSVGMNFNGECGTGKSSAVEFDWAPVAGLEDTAIKHVSCGFGHTLALSSDGDLFGWGRAHRGQLGIGSRDDQLEATLINTPESAFEGTKIVSMDAGFSHSAAICEQGRVWVFGKMQGSRISRRDDGTETDHFEDSLVPRELDVPDKAVRVACGHAHVAIVTESGRILMTGMRGRGIHYDETDGGRGEGVGAFIKATNVSDCVAEPIPVDFIDADVLPVERIVRLATDMHHTYAMLDDGRVVWWGWKLRPQPLDFVKGMHVYDVGVGLTHQQFLAEVNQQSI